MENQAAIITGSGRGIGKAIAMKLAHQKMNIAICDIDDESIALTVKEIEQLGVKTIGIKVDVTNTDQVANLFDAAMQAFGRIDVLVNNAGITRDTLLIRMQEHEWDSVIASTERLFQLSEGRSKNYDETAQW